MDVFAYDDKKGWGKSLQESSKSCNVILFREADELPTEVDGLYLRLDGPAQESASELANFVEECVARRPSQMFPSVADLIFKNNKYLQARALHFMMPAAFTTRELTTMLKYLNVASFPIIRKESMGAASSKVDILSSRGPALTKILTEVVAHGVRNYRNKIRENPYVFQRFIPNLPGDFRVIVVGQRIGWIVQRYNREETPLASGSGKFMFLDEFSGLAERLLTSGMELARSHNLLCLSADFAIEGDEVLLLELGCDFPRAFSNPPLLWEYEGSRWLRKRNSSANMFQELVLEGFSRGSFPLK